MFSSLQPSRPKIANQPPQNPMHQQQIRPASNDQQSQHHTTPRNQIEAMPPNQRSNDGPVPQPMNPALVHPVFFSEAWRKAPFPLPGTSGFSPAATGYVFGTVGAARRESSTKL